MIIRLATPEDKPALIAMGQHFASATHYGALFETTAEGIAELVDAIILADDDAAVVYVAADGSGVFGMIAAIAGVMTGSDERYAEETVWWVEPTRRGLRAGPRLMAALEGWALANGMNFVKMVAPIPSSVGRFYEKQGYRPIETAYAKRLT